PETPTFFPFLPFSISREENHLAGSSASLRAYVITRVLLMVPMLLILLTFTFLLLRVAPGDPVSAIYGEKGNPQVIDQIKRELGLYDPLYVQYFTYLRGVLTGNMGTSIVSSKDRKSTRLNSSHQ